MTCFYMKCNMGLKWVNLVSIFRDGVCPLFGTRVPVCFSDRFIDIEISNLIVICENKENGCIWRDRLGNYEVKNKLLTCLFNLF